MSPVVKGRGAIKIVSVRLSVPAVRIQDADGRFGSSYVQKFRPRCRRIERCRGDGNRRADEEVGNPSMVQVTPGSEKAD